MRLPLTICLLLGLVGCVVTNRSDANLPEYRPLVGMRYRFKEDIYLVRNPILGLYLSKAYDDGLYDRTIPRVVDRTHIGMHVLNDGYIVEVIPAGSVLIIRDIRTSIGSHGHTMKFVVDVVVRDAAIFRDVDAELVQSVFDRGQGAIPKLRETTFIEEKG